MTRKQITIIICLFLFVVMIFVAGVFAGKKTEQPAPQEQAPQERLPAAPKGSGLEILHASSTGGHSDFVPQEATATKPVSSAPTAPGAVTMSDLYEMTMSAKGFSPESITVPTGDLVQIRVTAADGDYDISIPYLGIRGTVRKGETKPIIFRATSPGTSLIECDKQCPATGKIQGTVIMIQR